MIFNSIPPSYKTLLYEKPSTKTKDEITITWFGTACELISDGETALLVDPFITRNAGVIDVLTNRNILQADPKNYDKWIAPFAKSIKAMLITHSHFDHILDAGEIGKRTNAMLIGSPSTRVIGKSLGLPEEQILVMSENRPIKIGKFEITFLKIKHSGIGVPSGETKRMFPFPARTFDMKEGGTYALYITHPLGNIVCYNSAVSIPGLLKGLSAKVVFLSIAQLPNNLDRFLKETIDELGASYIFPVHWDNFFQQLRETPHNLPFVANIDTFVKDINALRPNIKVNTLPVGKPQIIYPPR